ncbi:MAG: decaprenyl-phosphate phosphoribosyltransferase [Myxococcales bacterium]|nr:decaprenyl-phosphate phosphoribosyltransferase [Myxococcales bacterium]
MTSPFDGLSLPAAPALPVTLWRALRPRQWTKNLAVFAPLLFAKAVFVPGAAAKAATAMLAFCLLASGLYVVNDWVDREKDRLHPEKRQRPIAAGNLGGRGAFALAAACWAMGGALAYSVGPSFASVCGGYVALQLCYSLALKRLVILDVMAIAMGFVLRVFGGGVAITVPVSNWLFLCTLLLAVFLGFAKRRHELSSLQEEATAHRDNLVDYSLPMLDQMMSMVAAACILAYGLYSVSRETVEHVGSDRLKFTIPFVIYGIFRYLFLVHRRGQGGSPERVLLSDLPLVVNLALFVAVASWALYG